MKICQLTNSTEKQAVTRSILEALPEWFGIPEAREDYITESGDKQFFWSWGGINNRCANFNSRRFYKNEIKSIKNDRIGTFYKRNSFC